MNLIIDIGNTSTKVALFQNNKACISKKYKKLTLQLLEKLINQRNTENQIEAAIISTVSYSPDDIIKYLKKKYFFILFDETTPIPVKNRYLSPDTLGKDRLASAVAVSNLFPNQNVLCVDMGTCIKYDFVNSQNEYCGGAISPGFYLRFKALNTFTEKLPLVEFKPIDFLIGKNTEQSILSGVIKGTSLEIAGMISKYKSIYPDLQVVLSGGEMKNFDNDLKISIFAVANIVTLGLNFVLEYNKLVKNKNTTY